MSVDTIANFLSSIKNASMSGKASIETPYSKICESIAKIMAENGYIAEVKVFKEKDSSHKQIRLDLAYDEFNRPAVSDVYRVSKPGLRIYKGYKDLKLVAGGSGLSIISTSRGLMSLKEARYKKLGGEVVCKVL
ncbi:MAG: 30S ribosomal protein S8 [Patescibacteria group bacterium]